MPVLTRSFETGLLEFSNTQLGGGDLSQSALAALAGTGGGLSVLVNDTGDIYGENTFTAWTASQLWARLYLNVNTLAIGTNGHSVTLWSLYNATGTSRVFFYVTRSSGSLYFQLGVRNDSASTQLSPLAAALGFNGYITIRLQKSSAPATADGVGGFSLNGGAFSDTVPMIASTVFAYVREQIGAVSIGASVSGTYFMDETSLDIVDPGIYVPPIDLRDSRANFRLGLW